MTNIANWKITMFNWKINYKWAIYTMAMLNNQRVDPRGRALVLLFHSMENCGGQRQAINIFQLTPTARVSCNSVWDGKKNSLLETLRI
jgi:hypothetical protein